MKKVEAATLTLVALDTGPERKWRHVGPRGTPIGIVRALCGETFTAINLSVVSDLLARKDLCPDCKRILAALYS